MKYLGLHNKPKAAAHPEHWLTGLKKEEEKKLNNFIVFYLWEFPTQRKL